MDLLLMDASNSAQRDYPHRGRCRPPQRPLLVAHGCTTPHADCRSVARERASCTSVFAFRTSKRTTWTSPPHSRGERPCRPQSWGPQSSPPPCDSPPLWLREPAMQRLHRRRVAVAPRPPALLEAACCGMFEWPFARTRARARAEHVLRRMREGGWGMAHLNVRSADMPLVLGKPGKRMTCTDQIRDGAQL